MSRKQILEKFEAYRQATEDRINAGIEQNKKGYAYLTVKDADGNAVEGEIKINQKNHAFRFGANIFMIDQLETPEKNQSYKDDFKELFNMATLPFYWDDLEPEKGKPRYSKDSAPIYRRPPIDTCMEYCEQNGIEPREHALCYDHFFPKWLKDAPVGEVKKQYERRCKEISERYGDRINTIEVTNETWWGEGVTAWYEEPDFVEEAYRIARKYFATNKLTINEWSGIWNESQGRTNDRYFMQIERALSKGAPIDAIGLQFHGFFRKEDEYWRTRDFYDPNHLFKILDLYARFNKPLQITEVTIPCFSNDEEDEAVQAELLKWLYSLWFSHEKTEQIVYWNLVDGYAAFVERGDMTKGENYYYGGLIRHDFSKKPAYYMLKDLIHNQWHTKTECRLENGKTSFKGFYGDYDVEIKVGDKVYNKEISLVKGAKNRIEIKL